MPPIYDIKAPIKHGGKVLREGQVDLAEDVGVHLVGSGFLAPADVLDQLLIGSSVQPSIIEFPDASTLSLDELVQKAFDNTQLTIEQWNALDQADREQDIELTRLALIDEIEQRDRDPGDEQSSGSSFKPESEAEKSEPPVSLAPAAETHTATTEAGSDNAPPAGGTNNNPVSDELKDQAPGKPDVLDAGAAAGASPAQKSKATVKTTKKKAARKSAAAGK